MSIKKLEQYEASVVAESICGLYFKKGEKQRLYEICIKYKVPITYPKLFVDETHYYLWGIKKDKSIGLLSTIIMNYLSENNGTIFQSLDELEKNLKGEKCNEKY